MLKEILEESSEDDVLGYAPGQAKILADLGIKKHSDEEVAVLKSVVN